MWPLSTLVLLCGGWPVNAEINSLTYIYTAFTRPVGLPGIHEFSAMGLLDGRPIDYFDSDTPVKVPKEDWMKERLDKEYWDKGTSSRQTKQQWFKVNLKILTDRLRKNDTVNHYLQWRHGCEVNTTGSERKLSGIDQYGYDGDDFLSFDSHHKQWVAHMDGAILTKRKWDGIQQLNDYTDGYLHNECVQWLDTFLKYRKEANIKASPPEVYISARPFENNLKLSCLATGFHPKEITMNIRRDGHLVDRDDGLQSTGIRPNGDGTHQIKKWVMIPRGDTANYTCEVNHPASNIHVVEEWALLTSVALSPILPPQGQPAPPEVYISARPFENNLNLSCLATGFHPKEITMNIRRDGHLVDRYDGLETTGVRPNRDGTHQIKKWGMIPRGDTAKYTCEVIHPASNIHVVVEWALLTSVALPPILPPQGQPAPPEVYISARPFKDNLKLSCLATGFHPKEITMNIRRDGHLVDRDDCLQSTGVRPNGNGTHQIKMWVMIPGGDTAKYTCEVNHPASNIHVVEEWALLTSVALPPILPPQGQPAPPEVYISARPFKDNLKLSCLATGFHPKEITMNIRRDGHLVDRDDGLQSTGVRPSGDGTNQIKMWVMIPGGDTAKYTCEVNHPASNIHVVEEWDQGVVPVPPPIGLIVGAVVGLLVVVGLIITGVVIILRRRRTPAEKVVTILPVQMEHQTLLTGASSGIGSGPRDGSSSSLDHPLNTTQV
ncbi:uncharacterized protein LOC115535407 isoform X2 [Gadus morhua]|uniref:uncharacterized protein LOC115535407 isoform X2 n=1 Tax=Gadus morhua TaxID=8049 RepID=UPI0011B58E3A|nr:uncharacterized protein LOC115535407 isoform X2 [Gadus morhua]